MLQFEYVLFLLLNIALCPNTSNASESSDQNAVSEAVLYKCDCPMNEALKNGSCVPFLNKLLVWDAAQKTDLVVNISDFSSVSVKSVECQAGFSKLPLDVSQFIVYTNGLLSNLVFDEEILTQNYCIDYVIADEGLLSMHANVCEANPTIPICCPPGFVLSIEGECEYTEGFVFNPKLVGDFPWREFNLTVHNITCGEGEVFKSELLTLPTKLGTSLGGYPLGSQLKWNSLYHEHSKYFGYENYCISPSITRYGLDYYAKFCVPDPKLEHLETCKNETCLRKCCPFGFIYDNLYSNCVPSNNHQLKYKFIDANGHETPDPENLTLIFGIPFCHSQSFLLPGRNAESGPLKFSSDGSLVTAGGVHHSSLHYCVDGFTHNFTNPDSPVINTAIICFGENKEPCEWRWITVSVMLGISCFFYFVTLVVYLSITELRSKMVGKCLISEVTSLLVSYLILIFLQNTDNYSELTCNFPGTVAHIAILASFFWLNVMCFDMWSKIKQMTVPTEKRRSIMRRFLAYSVYAWGMPLLIASIRFIIDSLPNSFQHPALVRANMGSTHCFLDSNNVLAKWLYLYVPILVLLLVNLFFFVHVAVIIVRTKRDTAKLLAGENSAKTGKKNWSAKKEKVILYLKLFLVMGISWLLEIIMWMAVPENDCYFWGLDIVNMFQGVFIFVIFVCKKSTIDKETFEAKREEVRVELKRKEDEMRQTFILRVKEKETDLKEVEKELYTKYDHLKREHSEEKKRFEELKKRLDEEKAEFVKRKAQVSNLQLSHTLTVD